MKVSELLRPVLSSLAAQRDLHKTASEILEAARTASDADAAAVTTARPSGDLRVLAVVGARMPRQRSLPLETSVNGTIVRTGGILLSRDVRDETACGDRGLAAVGFRGFAGVPLESRNRVLGTLVVARRRRQGWTEAIQPVLVPFARCMSIALQQQQLRRYVQSHVFALLGDRRGDGETFRERTRLSVREREVAELLVAGRSCKEIGVTLDMSTRTVQHHVDRMKVRFGRNTLHGLTARLVDTLR